MRIFRWIIFIPACIAFKMLSEMLAGMIIYWAYDQTFPLNGFWPFVSLTFFFFPVISGVLTFYAVGIGMYLTICPSFKIGSIVILIVSIMLLTAVLFFNFTKAVSHPVILILEIVNIVMIGFYTMKGEK